MSIQEDDDSRSDNDTETNDVEEKKILSDEEDENEIELLFADGSNFRSTIQAFRLIQSSIYFFFSQQHFIIFINKGGKENKKGKSKKKKSDITGREDFQIHSLQYVYSLNAEYLCLCFDVEEIHKNTKTFSKKGQVQLRISAVDPTLLNIAPLSANNLSMQGVVQIRGKLIEFDSIELPSTDEYPEPLVTKSVGEPDINQALRGITSIGKELKSAIIEVREDGFLLRASSDITVHTYFWGKEIQGKGSDNEQIAIIELTKDALEALKKNQVSSGVCSISYYSENKHLVIKRTLGTLAEITWII